MAERRSTGPAVQGSRVAGIVAAIAALMLVYVIAGPALAQSPGASGSPTTSAAASVAASPTGAPASAAPSGTGLPDTAIGDPTTNGGSSPIGFLLLGIGAVAAVLVYMGMRGSELRKAPAGSERDPRS